MRKFNPEEVEFTLTAEYEDLPLDDAFDLGSDELNEELISEISKRLEYGDVWAWAYVKITARWAGFEGTATIGGCNYKDEDDFKQNSGYYRDLLKDALYDCLKTVKEEGWEVEGAAPETVQAAVAKVMKPVYQAQLRRTDVPKEVLLEAHKTVWDAYGEEHCDGGLIALELQDAGYYPSPEKTSDDNADWLHNNLPNEPLAQMLEEAGLVAIWGHGWFRPEDVDPARHKTHDQGRAEAGLPPQPKSGIEKG